MAGRKSRARGNPCGRCFVTGLAAGALLFIAAYFLLPDPGREQAAESGQPVAEAGQDNGAAPRFEFYSILPEMEVAEQIEQRIDASRKMLRKSAVKRMKESENVKAEMIYVDILNEMERIGNDALNIVHALNHVV